MQEGSTTLMVGPSSVQCSIIWPKYLFISDMILNTWKE